MISYSYVHLKKKERKKKKQKNQPKETNEYSYEEGKIKWEIKEGKIKSKQPYHIILYRYTALL